MGRILAKMPEADKRGGIAPALSLCRARAKV